MMLYVLMYRYWSPYCIISFYFYRKQLELTALLDVLLKNQDTVDISMDALVNLP